LLKKQIIGAIAGIVAPTIAFICILAAIASDSQFSWTNNALSDLGIVQGVTGLLFNFGLVICGILAFTFVLFGLLNCLEKNKFSRIGVAAFAVAAFALLCIGIFNEKISPAHYLFSVAFFVMLPISLLIITRAFVLQHQAKIALFTIIVAAAAAAPWILYFAIDYVPNVAIPEFFSGLAGAVWIIVLGYKILKKT
jgi:hypothetical membrane protein